MRQLNLVHQEKLLPIIISLLPIIISLFNHLNHRLLKKYRGQSEEPCKLDILLFFTPISLYIPRDKDVCTSILLVFHLFQTNNNKLYKGLFNFMLS